MSFAAALYGAAGSLRSSCKPGKWESFGCQFTGVIVADNATIKPFGKLNGQLVIELGWPISHLGIRIQLEAQCILKFDTHLDNRVSFHKKYDNILQGSGELESTYQLSPIMIDILPQKPTNSTERYELPAGNNRFRFTLSTPEEMLPAPFKTSYGSLVYKLVAYMYSENRYQWVSIGEKILKFQGYHNLSQNIDALKPIQVERSVKKSIFSSKKILRATLDLDSCGYLPLENLNFTLWITNPKCLPLKMWVTLHQRVVYNVDGAKKATIAVLDSLVHEITEPGSESMWVDTLKVHKAASPSYYIHPMYTVSHTLQFKVKVDEYGIVKADVPIFIGTTREPVELLMISANSLSVLDDRFPARRGSTSSTHSEYSGLSNFSFPPAYSLLSSRKSSLETLPPPYNDEDDSNFCKGLSIPNGLIVRVISPDDDTSGNCSQHDTTPTSTATSPVDD